MILGNLYEGRMENSDSLDIDELVDLTKDVLFPDQCFFVLCFSSVTLAVFVYLLWQGFRLLALIPLSVLATSVCYWGNKPQLVSWTRFIDVVVVLISAAVQLYVSLYSSTGAYYWFFMVLSGLFYAESHYLAWPAHDPESSLSVSQKKFILWGATFAHCLVYLSAAFAGVILLSGDIVGLW
jgi:hypothetical protein